MTDAPEKMWRERIAPSQMYPAGGSFYHETPTKQPAVEYIRADLARPMTVAEAALRLIDEINRPATHEEKPDWRYLSRLDMTSLRALSEGGE